jgi:hypothetical protein
MFRTLRELKLFEIGSLVEILEQQSHLSLYRLCLKYRKLSKKKKTFMERGKKEKEACCLNVSLEILPDNKEREFF